MRNAISGLIAAVMLMSCLLCPAVCRAEKPTSTEPALVPWPKSITSAVGFEPLTSGTRIVVSDTKLQPLATLLSQEICRVTALKLPTARKTGGSGDIILRLSDKMKADEGYLLTVSAGTIVVEGRTYRGIAWGTASLVQAMYCSGDKWGLPRMTILDEPVAKYRGLLIDVARRWHPIESLLPIIEMCRLYKINYIQLHLNDQQSTVFTFKAYPQLASTYKGHRRTYTLDEITSLVKYADERGVTIIPELEGPGHHAGNLRNIWGRGHTLDIANEKTYQGLKVLIGELCVVFKSSPYIHIGADEGSFGALGKSDEEKAYMARHGVKRGLLNHYIKRVDEIVKSYGKRTICWEGFHGDGGGLPKDIIVMPFESTYNPAGKLVKHGFSVINTAWKPLYVVNRRNWPAQYIYENWNLWLWEHHVNTRTHIQLKRSDPVLGAQMCAWEQQPEIELPSTRCRIHAMSERIWNPDANRNYADFAGRCARTDELLDRLIGAVAVQAHGITGEQDRGYEFFAKPFTVSLSAPAIGTIHYTLDGEDPTADSPQYEKPIHITTAQTRHKKMFFNSRTKRFMAQGPVCTLKARIFDAAGKPVGEVITIRNYWYKGPDAPKSPAVPKSRKTPKKGK